MPLKGEHACRLHPPGGYVRFRRQNGIGEVDGKRLDAIIGFKEGGGSEVQSFRYPLSEGWAVAQARSHCGEHEGGFEEATGEEMRENIAILEAELREQELEALDKYRQGLAPAPFLYKPMGTFLKAAGVDGLMVFVASEETEDRIGDIIRADGWDLKAYQKNPVYLFSHDHSIPPIGTVPRVWKDGKQLLNTVRWDEADPFAAFVKGKYERGVMKAQSVGFRPIEFKPRIDAKGMEFIQQELLEISACAIPAHPAAVMRALGDRRFGMVQPIPVLDEMTRTEWDVAWINDLPDSAFAVILSGGEKDGDGKTVPRSLRRLPHHNMGGNVDLPHLRNALARLPQTDMPADAKAKAKRHLEAHAETEGVGERHEHKHEELAEEDLDLETIIAGMQAAFR